LTMSLEPQYDPESQVALLGGGNGNNEASEKNLGAGGSSFDMKSIFFNKNDTPLTLAKASIAELVGTFLFEFFGGLACTYGAMHAGEPGAAGIAGALGNGLALWLVIEVTAPVSDGHINPAVSIAMLVCGKIKIVRALLYVLVQLIGAVLGAVLAKGLMPNDAAYDFTALGLYTKTGGIDDPFKGMMLEMIGAFLFLNVIYATAVTPNSAAKKNHWGPFSIGLTITTLALCIGFFSGCAINPARAFGPAIAFNVWTNQWVYWVGPIVGGSLGALFYKYLVEPPLNPLPKSV